MKIFTDTPKEFNKLLKAHDNMVKSLTNLESNCCGAAVLGADSNGHGTCSDCKENTVGIEIKEWL